MNLVINAFWEDRCNYLPFLLSFEMLVICLNQLPDAIYRPEPSRIACYIGLDLMLQLRLLGDIFRSRIIGSDNSDKEHSFVQVEPGIAISTYSGVVNVTLVVHGARGSKKLSLGNVYSDECSHQCLFGR
jgi:hypothetical protein